MQHSTGGKSFLYRALEHPALADAAYESLTDARVVSWATQSTTATDGTDCAGARQPSVTLHVDLDYLLLSSLWGGKNRSSALGGQQVLCDSSYLCSLVIRVVRHFLLRLLLSPKDGSNHQTSEENRRVNLRAPHSNLRIEFWSCLGSMYNSTSNLRDSWQEFVGELGVESGALLDVAVRSGVTTGIKMLDRYVSMSLQRPETQNIFASQVTLRCAVATDSTQCAAMATRKAMEAAGGNSAVHHFLVSDNPRAIWFGLPLLCGVNRWIRGILYEEQKESISRRPHRLRLFRVSQFMRQMLGLSNNGSTIQDPHNWMLLFGALIDVFEQIRSRVEGALWTALGVETLPFIDQPTDSLCKKVGGILEDLFREFTTIKEPGEFAGGGKLSRWIRIMFPSMVRKLLAAHAAGIVMRTVKTHRAAENDGLLRTRAVGATLRKKLPLDIEMNYDNLITEFDAQMSSVDIYSFLETHTKNYSAPLNSDGDDGRPTEKIKEEEELLCAYEERLRYYEGKAASISCSVESVQKLLDKAFRGKRGLWLSTWVNELNNAQGVSDTKVGASFLAQGKLEVVELLRKAEHKRVLHRLLSLVQKAPGASKNDEFTQFSELMAPARARLLSHVLSCVLNIDMCGPEEKSQQLSGDQTSASGNYVIVELLKQCAFEMDAVAGNSSVLKPSHSVQTRVDGDRHVVSPKNSPGQTLLFVLRPQRRTPQDVIFDFSQLCLLRKVSEVGKSQIVIDESADRDALPFQPSSQPLSKSATHDVQNSSQDDFLALASTVAQDGIYRCEPSIIEQILHCEPSELKLSALAVVLLYHSGYLHVWEVYLLIEALLGEVLFRRKTSRRSDKENIAFIDWKPHVPRPSEKTLVRLFILLTSVCGHLQMIDELTEQKVSQSVLQVIPQWQVFLSLLYKPKDQSVEDDVASGEEGPFMDRDELTTWLSKKNFSPCDLFSSRGSEHIASCSQFLQLMEKLIS